ncbi:MAG: DUF342 domain-containing protein [Desulfobacula sp.]|nr:DUF342 domain-containing protein [Desulfobacula sp.]
MVKGKKDKIEIPLIGQLAVKNLLITKEELQKGVKHCSAAENKLSALKEYFLSNELISLKNIERLARAAKALEFRQKEFKFGSIAIQKGFINKSVLTLALEEQQNELKNKNKISYIGEMLVDAGLLTEKQKGYILKLQKRVRKENQKSIKEEKGNIDIVQEDQSNINSNEIYTEIILEDNSDKNLLLEPETITGGIKLEVAKNFMTAFFTKSISFDENISVDQIKEALFDKDIVSGIVVDDMIQGFISSSGFKTKAFKIAQGLLPIHGKNAKVEFFFNTDYLTAGGMAEDGVIDFKDRGEIPLVEEGTVLAEKIPMVESCDGHNIYGEKVETVPGKDIAMKYGSGVKISEDGVKLIADVAGFPKFSLAGRVFVNAEYITQGDVDYETGHINFDGNVNVKGRVKSGFKVKGNDIKIIELDGGIVSADGNVRVAGGINEGKIYARGNIYAKFIHNSEVSCMGNVFIAKEIVDSEIECSGRCVVENGKIISSLITAKLGVTARSIGTEKAEPCKIKVGHDVVTKKELKSNNDKLESLEKQIKHHGEQKDKLNIENRDIQKQITELAHVQDRAQLEEKEINSKIVLMEKDPGNISSIKEMKNKIALLKTDAQNAEAKLDICFDKSEKLEQAIEEENGKIISLNNIQKDLLAERANITQLAKDFPGQSIVIVKGEIMNGNLIKGLHSEKRVSEIIRHAKIVETLCTSEGGKSLNMYEMQVKNI